VTELEKADKLREKANVSYTEAKEALANTGGDLLDALIYLEKQGKSVSPVGGGYYSGSGAHKSSQQSGYGSESATGSTSSGRGCGSGESFSDLLKRFGRFCMKVLDKGMANHLDAIKNDELMFSCPALAAAVLVLFFFWVTVPLFVISLFLGFRYQFRGPDLGRDSVNRVMEGASDVADEVRKSFTDDRENGDRGD
jgi:hypothetical protein